MLLLHVCFAFSQIKEANNKSRHTGVLLDMSATWPIPRLHVEVGICRFGDDQPVEYLLPIVGDRFVASVLEPRAVPTSGPLEPNMSATPKKGPWQKLEPMDLSRCSCPFNG